MPRRASARLRSLAGVAGRLRSAAADLLNQELSPSAGHLAAIGLGGVTFVYATYGGAVAALPDPAASD